MDRMNMAYDLSFNEMEQERQIARKEKKESILIKAQTKFSLGRKIANIIKSKDVNKETALTIPIMLLFFSSAFGILPRTLQVP